MPLISNLLYLQSSSATKLQLLLFPVIPVLLAMLVLVVISVVAYLWFRRNPLNLK
ncbi:hypothetical protein [Flavihumibacter fluvii]|uniref:hypothetical protein n=1 Tax=Flavihumibacter fluvii TaxID=2838157 RepID=UPI001BDE079E|nr:hypothetical protein [Flavihumibacter fluvii]ULQ53002.1 hypothetical protein KJS93_01560 [Flavihumibacter fluvii]